MQLAQQSAFSIELASFFVEQKFISAEFSGFAKFRLTQNLPAVNGCKKSKIGTKGKISLQITLMVRLFAWLKEIFFSLSDLSIVNAGLMA